MKPAQIWTIELKVNINAPKEQVFDTMLNDLASWWPKDFVCIPNSPGVKLEPKLGGRLFEETEDGSSILWGTLIQINKNDSLHFAGFITPDFGGPAINTVKLAVSDGENGTTDFHLTNGNMGTYSEEGIENVTSGWKYLFEGGLKTFVESKS